MQNSRFKKSLKFLLPILLAVLMLAVFLLPLPKYIEGPGDATNLKSVVKIAGHPDRKAGQYMLTTVALAQATPASYLYAKLTPTYSIEDVDAVTGGQDDVTYDRVQQFYMQSAINEAIYTAYHNAKQQVTREYRGIYILSVTANSKFKGVLRVGDTITRVNGRHFSSAAQYQKYIQSRAIGSNLRVTFYRNGKQLTATRPLTKLAGTNRAGIGVTLTDDLRVKTRIPVKVDPGAVGGPSGGLMFSLQIYGQLTGNDIRQGRKVAGTGTINPDGSVGEIGGIDKKIIAAKRSGATVFLAPYVKPTKLVEKLEPDHLTNYQLAVRTAKKYAPEMRVIPVTSFQDALRKLQK